MTADRTTEVLAELGWLRGLAQHLAGEGEADDLVQDVAVAALAAPPGPFAQPRAWLAAVLRNVAASRARRRRARSQYEAAAARAEATAGTDELVQRAERQRELVDAVLRLDAPYRDAVLQRFFDGLPPRAIAARAGVPVATIHSRLQRALQRLRGELEARHGPGERWLAAFAPLLHAPASPAGAAAMAGTAGTVGAILMQAKTVVVAAALLCGAALWFVSGGGETDGVAPGSAAARELRGSRGSGSGPAPAATTAQHERLDAGHVPESGAAPAAEAGVDVAGIVFDAAGLRCAGVPIARRSEPGTLSTSDAGGKFTVRVPPSPCMLVAAGERFVTVLGGAWSPQSSLEPALVVALSLRLEGRVVSGDGAPIAQAKLVLDLPADFGTRFPAALDLGLELRTAAAADAYGAFALAAVPAVPGATLFVSAPGFRPANVPLPTGDDLAMTVTLQPYRATTGSLAGHVVDAGGAPCPGARVALGLTSVVSDGDGAFSISLQRAGSPGELVAAKAGALPARLLPRSGDGTSVEHWPSPLVLRLGQAPLTISGRVVTDDGQPVARAEVWVANPEAFGVGGIRPLQLEYLLAGGDLPRGADREPPHADDPLSTGNVTVNIGSPPSPSAGFWYAVADDRGKFTVHGLLPRDYVLKAADPATNVQTERGAVAAGSTGVDLVVARTAEHVWPVLRGTVRSLHGTPLAGVEVRLMSLSFATSARVPGGRYEGQAVRYGQTAQTGADGTFAFQGVGRVGTSLHVSGDAVIPADIPLGRDIDPLAVVATVQARCHVEVVLIDPAQADAISARDADGNVSELVLVRGGSTRYESTLQLFAGKSGVFAIGEGATVLLLKRDNATVREVPLQLRPGTVTQVQ